MIFIGREKKYKYLMCATVIIWLLLIFILSHQPVAESSKLSQQVTDTIAAVIEKVNFNPEFKEKLTNYSIRKNVHFFIFLALGGLLMTAFTSFGMTGWKEMFGFICVVHYFCHI